jgi:general secretion pathway protein I
MSDFIANVARLPSGVTNPATAAQPGAAVPRAFAPARTHGARDGRRGFTLIEILATLLLVAIILPVAMSGISLALNVADESKRRTEAAALAQSKLAEIVAYSEWTTASLGGDFSPDRPQYRWAAQVTAWQGTQLQQLDVQVLWRSRGQDHHVTLSTLVYAGISE